MGGREDGGEGPLPGALARGDEVEAEGPEQGEWTLPAVGRRDGPLPLHRLRRRHHEVAFAPADSDRCRVQPATNIRRVGEGQGKG